MLLSICLLVLCSFITKIFVAAPRTRKVVDRTQPLGPDFVPETVAAYRKGGVGLGEFCQLHGWTMARLAEEHPRTINDLIMRWIMESFALDRTRGHATAGLLFFKQQFRWCRQTMQPCWRLLKSWPPQEPIGLRHPASDEQTRGLVSAALEWGWWRMALLISLGFVGLLRPGELCTFLWRNVRIVRALRLATIVIVQPKARRTAARRQHVIIDDPILVQILTRLKELCWPESLVGGACLTYAMFLARLHALCRAVGLEALLTPSSSRAGGATWHWLCLRDFHGLRLRGRWAAARSLEHYIQERVCFLQENELSIQTRARLQRLAAQAKRRWAAFLSSL